LLFVMKSKNYPMIIPEIIKLELVKHTGLYIHEACGKIQENFRILEMIMGQRDDYHLPSDDDISNRVETRLAELRIVIEEIPFSFEHAKSSITRVMEETPPNSHKNQQYKDSAIWEAILESASSDDIVFITADTGFYKNGDYEKGLAQNLKNDVQKVEHDVKIHSGIKEFLDTMEEDIPAVNKEEIIQKIHLFLKEHLMKQAFNEGFNLDDYDAEVKPFLTENPGVLTIDFLFSFTADETKGPEYTGGVQKVKGSCSWDMQPKRIFNLELNDRGFYNKNGDHISGSGVHVFMQIDSSTRPRLRPYRLKVELPGTDDDE